jgi:hypothetical protein
MHLCAVAPVQIKTIPSIPETKRMFSSYILNTRRLQASTSMDQEAWLKQYTSA